MVRHFPFLQRNPLLFTIGDSPEVAFCLTQCGEGIFFLANKS
jgi:hypothetical protein